MRRLLLALIVALGAAVSGVGSLALGAWLAWERHHFGPWDPRVLLFVRGTWTAAIGIVDPVPGTLRYEAEGPDGPGVGFLYTRYRTRAAPEAVLQAFRAGCERLGLDRDPEEAPSAPDGTSGAACRRGDLAIGLAVNGSEVSLKEDLP